MGLRIRVLVIIGLTMAGVALVLSFAAVLLMRTQFGALERDEAARTSGLVRASLDDQVRQLEGVAAAWALRESTYRFMRGEDPGFIGRELSEASVDEFGADAVIFMDIDGRVVHAEYIDLEIGVRKEADTVLLDAVRDAVGLRLPGDPRGMVSGVFRLPDGAAFVAARSITRSDLYSPPAGTLVLVRRMDAQTIGELQSAVGMPVAAFSADGGPAPEDVVRARSSLQSGTSDGAEALSEDTMGVYVLTRDFAGAPALIIRAEAPRNTYREGLSILRGEILAIVLLAGLAAALGFVATDRAVLARVKTLSSQVESIGDRGGASARVEVSGRDELSHLARDVNRMLARIEDFEEEMQSANEELADTAERLRTASEAKTRFLANMSHDLRTPLHSIIGFSGVLLSGAAGPLTEEQTTQLTMVQAAGRHLLTLVNDTLDLARIESGRLSVSVADFDVRPVLQGLGGGARIVAAEKGLGFKLEMPADPVLLRTDEVRLRQVLDNLMSNALKYTERGEVTVKLARGPEGGVRFVVADTGCGMAPDEVETAFRPFVQLGAPEKGRPSGAGLGLAIVRAVSEALGGSIDVDTAPERGSTFTFDLPPDAVVSMPEE